MISTPIDFLLTAKQLKSATHKGLSRPLDEGLQESDHSPSAFALTLVQLFEQPAAKDGWAKIAQHANPNEPQHRIKNFASILGQNLHPGQEKMLRTARFSLDRKTSEPGLQNDAPKSKQNSAIIPHVLSGATFEQKDKPKHISTNNYHQQKNSPSKSLNLTKSSQAKLMSNTSIEPPEELAGTAKNVSNTTSTGLMHTTGMESNSAFPSLQTAQLAAPNLVSTQSPNLNHSIPVFEDKLNLHVQHPQWPQQLGKNLLRIASNATSGQSVAQIRLDPPHLGPLQVNLHLQEGQISAQFFSPHAYVRQSVEQALPQLLQQFEQSGLELGNTSVGGEQQTADEQYLAYKQALNQNQRKAEHSSTDIDSPTTEAETPANPTVFYSQPQSIINTFA